LAVGVAFFRKEFLRCTLFPPVLRGGWPLSSTIAVLERVLGWWSTLFSSVFCEWALLCLVAVLGDRALFYLSTILGRWALSRLFTVFGDGALPYLFTVLCGRALSCLVTVLGWWALSCLLTVLGGWALPGLLTVTVFDDELWWCALFAAVVRPRGIAFGWRFYIEEAVSHATFSGWFVPGASGCES